MKKLFIIVNHDWFFLSHRQAIAVAAKEAGWNVTIVCCDTGRFDDIHALGLKAIDLPINATGMNLKDEWKTFQFLRKLYKKELPDVVHHVGLKTMLLGGLAAKLVGVHGVVNAVSGLGTLFNGDRPSMVARVVMRVMRFSNSRKNVVMIFQNHEDEGLFYKFHVVKPGQSAFVKGSGVDLKDFVYTPDPVMTDDVMHIIFTARMVREKGVMVLIKAAEKLRKAYEGKIDFWLCGRLSTTPKALTEEELRSRCDGRYIQWLEFLSDVKELLRKSSIVAFPSWYREGVPKSLIEACAAGRPIVTCNSIGCKDVVDDGVNGFLIPVRDSDALVDKLRILIEDRDLRIKMGKAAREKAEREFTLDTVVQKHLEIYEGLVIDKKEVAINGVVDAC